MSNYIKVDDITDQVLRQIGDSAILKYIERTDQEIDDIAERHGITDTTQIETSPVHRKIIDFGRFYCMSLIARDRIGTNNVDVAVATEKYYIKYELYNKLANDHRSALTYEMFTGQVSERSQRAVTSGQLFNG